MTTQLGNIWSEIDYHFVKDAQGVLKTDVNVAAVMNSIDCILKTRRGERVFLPEFGSILAGMVFEPMNATSIKFLSRTLKDDIERWDDRVNILAVDIYSDIDRGAISITISFKIRGLEDILRYQTEVNGEG